MTENKKLYNQAYAALAIVFAVLIVGMYVIGYFAGKANCNCEEPETTSYIHRPTHRGCIGCEPVKICDEDE